MANGRVGRPTKKEVELRKKQKANSQRKSIEEYSEKQSDDKFLQQFIKASNNVMNGGLNGLLGNAILQNQVLKQQGILPSKYPRSKIEEMLENPNDNELVLAQIGRYVYNTVSQYRRIIHYFASMSRYRWILIPQGIDSDDIKDKRFKKSYNKALSLIEGFNVEDTCYRIAKQMLLEDSGFYFKHYDDNGELRLMKLPREWCMIDYKSVENGYEFGYSFNMMYFTRIGVDLNSFPSEFREWYDEYLGYKSDNIIPNDVTIESNTNHLGGYSYWKQIPPDLGKVFKFDNETPVNVPPFASVFADSMSISEYKSLYLSQQKMNTLKLIVNKIGSYETKNGDYDLKLDGEMASSFTGLMNSSINEGQAKFVTSPFEDQKVLDFSSSSQTKDNVIGVAQNSLLTGTGVASAMLGEATGALAIKYSSMTDDGFILPVIHKQMEKFLNSELRNSTGSFRFKIKFLDITRFNEDEMFSRYLQGANAGFPKLLVSAVLGINQGELDSLLNLEDYLGLSERLLPLLSANTMSGTEAIDGTKPKNLDGNVSDETDKSKANGTRGIKGLK